MCACCDYYEALFRLMQPIRKRKLIIIIEDLEFVLTRLPDKRYGSKTRGFASKGAVNALFAKSVCNERKCTRQCGMI